MIPLFYLILLPIVFATAQYFFHKFLKNVGVIIFQLILLGLSILIFIEVKSSGNIVEILGNYQQGIGISLIANNLAAVFVIFNTFLFTCMIIFNRHKPYMNNLFMFLFLVLQGICNGIFLAQDLFTLYILIELSVIIVSILIMFKKDTRSIYDGMIYFLTNIVAMTLYLLALAFIYKIFGTMDINILKDRMTRIQDPQTVFLPYSLIITAVGLKAAVMPLFSWLPRAYGTPSSPSIVSAIMSSIYVKTAVFLFIRFNDLFSSQIDTHEVMMILGFLTAVVGFVFAMSQKDIKLILAYSTVSQIGLIIYGLSINNDYSYWGSIYHIFNHAVFKAVLFLTAGMIIEVYGTKDITKIKGVFKRLPYISVISIIAILGITGAPFFNGSISKYLIQAHTYHDLFELGIMFINLGTVLVFLKYLSCFLGQPNIADHEIEHQPFTGSQYVIITILSVICFVGGILGIQVIWLLFDFKVEINTIYYLRKSSQFVVMLILGILFYKYIFKRMAFFKKIYHIELTFNQIVLSLVTFFAGMLAYLNIFSY